MIRPLDIFILFFLTFLTCSNAKTITVKVADIGLVFSPQNISANKNDIISFSFVNGKHDLVQGDSPGVCVNSTTDNSLSTGIRSQGEKYDFTITQSNGSIYFFCAYGQHCSDGEWGVINIGSSAGNSSASINAPNSFIFFLLFTITFFFVKLIV